MRVESGADLECLRPQVETLVRAARPDARIDPSAWCYLDGELSRRSLRIRCASCHQNVAFNFIRLS